jgi:hypothetical protein
MNAYVIITVAIGHFERDFGPRGLRVFTTLDFPHFWWAIYNFGAGLAQSV